MTDELLTDTGLNGKVVAVPEARQLDVFAGLLERRGAVVLRCPLVAIKDAPDPQPVLDWIRAFNAGSCDDLILLTGEGLRRLLSCIAQHAPELHDAFVQRLMQVRLLVRGPKPARVLRELRIHPELQAAEPTTQGVITTLKSLAIDGRRIGVQLYGADPNLLLIDYLRSAGATALPVAPYVYADASEDAAVRDLLARMTAGEVDIIAFTSMAQIKRLAGLATPEQLQSAFARVQVAAVGPVVRDALTALGIQVNCMPEDSFFMKPLVTVMGEMVEASGD